MVGKRRGFGAIRRLPSKRYQASFIAPDLTRHNAEQTFETRQDAEGWLTDRRREVDSGEWKPTGAARKVTLFGEYAELWVNERELKPRTRELYEGLLRKHILPTFQLTPVKAIDAAMVRRWHGDMPAKRPTVRAHAYGLLRTILATAASDGLIVANPAQIRGGGTTQRVHKVRPATLAELEALTAAMPDRYRAMTLVAAWCGLRFGELAELRRKDLDLTNGVIRIRRGVVRVAGAVSIGTPKSAAGVRDVAIPPHLIPALRDHLANHAGPGKSGLLFPAANGGTLAPSTLYKVFYPARDKAGRPDLRWHDLRHTGAVLAASTGATLAELMGRLGHSTPGAAMRYQHAAQGRDAIIAARLSELASTEGN